MKIFKISNKFYYGVVIGALILLSIIYYTNSYIDYKGIYSISEEDKDRFSKNYVDMLLESDNALPQVAAIRRFKYALLNQKKSDCYLVGSSRFMEIDLNTVSTLKNDCTNVLNLWAPGAGLEDVLSFSAEILDKTHIGKVFIELRLKSLYPESTALWRDVENKYSAALKTFDIAIEKNYFSANVQYYLNRFSLQYLSTNLRSFYIPELIRSKKRFRSLIDNIGNGDASFLRQPTESEDVNYKTGRSRHAEKVVHSGWNEEAYLKFPVKSPAFEERYYKILFKTFDKLKRSGLEPIIVLMPYNNNVWSCRNEKYCGALNEASGKIRKLAQELSINLIGSFNPQDMGLQATDFYDSIHLDYHKIDNVFKFKKAKTE